MDRTEYRCNPFLLTYRDTESGFFKVLKRFSSKADALQAVEFEHEDGMGFPRELAVFFRHDADRPTDFSLGIYEPLGTWEAE